MLRCRDHNNTMLKVPDDYEWFCTSDKHTGSPAVIYPGSKPWTRHRAVIGGGQWQNFLKNSEDICSCGRCNIHMGEGLYVSE